MIFQLLYAYVGSFRFVLEKKGYRSKVVLL